MVPELETAFRENSPKQPGALRLTIPMLHDRVYIYTYG